jgi:hypothetical protein
VGVVAGGAVAIPLGSGTRCPSPSAPPDPGPVFPLPSQGRQASNDSPSDLHFFVPSERSAQRQKTFASGVHSFWACTGAEQATNTPASTRRDTKLPLSMRDTVATSVPEAHIGSIADF